MQPQPIAQVLGITHQQASRRGFMTRRELNILLAARGLTLRQFALDKGYLPRTVQLVVQRYLGKNRQPRGRLSYAILRDLSREIGVEIVPGVLAEDKE
jgi:hypothetical protein